MTDLELNPNLSIRQVNLASGYKTGMQEWQCWLIHTLPPSAQNDLSIFKVKKYFTWQKMWEKRMERPDNLSQW